MRKIIIMAYMLAVALSSVSCANETPSLKDEPSQSVTENANDGDFYIVTDSEYATISYLVTISYWCEAMSDDLKAYDAVLFASANDPEHDCLMCKLKALKFFYQHEMYGDTTAEACENDDFEKMLSNNQKLRAVWETIEL